MPHSVKLTDIGSILPGALLIVDDTDKIINADASGWKIVRSQSGTDHCALATIFAEPEKTIKKYLQMCRRNRVAVPGRFTVLTQDGTQVEFSVSGAQLKSGNNGEVCLYLQENTSSKGSRRFTLLNESIEKLKLEIKRRQHIEGMLEAEKRTLASVIAGEPLNDALEILARAVEQHSGGMLVSILLADADKKLRHAVAPTLPKSYVQSIDGVAIGPAVGSCGTAAHSAALVIVYDVETDPKWVDFRAAAGAAGLRSCWSAPIMATNKEVLGTLAMYYKTPREPTESELQLIANSAYIAAVAIERFQAQQLLTKILKKEQEGREEAEAQNRAKDEFLAMLGHELRNPLGAITNATLALSASEGDSALSIESSHALLKIILSESQLLKRILDDLLDISRLSRGKLRLRKEPILLDEFADKVVTGAHATYPNRRLFFDIGNDLGVIKADVSRISQSIQNLLDNAVKYSSVEDTITLSIQANDEAAIFKISDTGQGIDKSKAKTIFEPFVQLDNSIARGNSGIGLGLSLVKRFALMHGGDVTMRSAGVSHGSEFVLTIPRGDVTQSVDIIGDDVADEPSARKRVLVVEDNESAREGLCQLLKLWGHEVLSAKDGQEALEIFRQSPPDVALVDIGLPILNGYQVAKSIRGDPNSAQVELVALTGYGQKSDRDRALEAGFDSHLVKPADYQDLIKILGAPQ